MQAMAVANKRLPLRNTRPLTRLRPCAFLEHTRNRERGMLPLYAARIEDLGQGDFVKVDCAACHHVALLTQGALLKLGFSPQAKVLDLKERVRCRGCGKRGRAVVSIKWARGSR
jgi:ribosomal protein S27E